MTGSPFLQCISILANIDLPASTPIQVMVGQAGDDVA
jgi:hypothetical protein